MGVATWSTVPDAHHVAHDVVRVRLARAAQSRAVTGRLVRATVRTLPSATWHARLGGPVTDELASRALAGPSLRHLRETVLAHRPTVVVSFGPRANIAAVLACRQLPVRVVISERNDPVRRAAGTVVARLRPLVYGQADVVTANAEGVLLALAQWVPPDRLRFAPNVLVPPAERRPPARREPSILIVARLAAHKSHDVLPDALALLPADLDGWRLAIVGTGDEDQRLRNHARRLGVADRVDWHGSTDDPSPFYRHCEIFALPSRYEGLPNALLEAMSFGLPPIVSDAAPGPLEVVHHGTTGLVVPTGDPGALASAIEVLARTPELRQRLGDAARREVRRFDPAVAIPAWEELLGLRRSDPRPVPA